jgi:peptidoglycan LD-endopeptidase CwlK
MTIYLSKTSLAKLKGVDPRLVRVVLKAAQLATTEQDFSVEEGVRTLARQKRLYAQGRTKPGKIVTWTLKSKHIEGKAVDLLPYPEGWSAKLSDFNAIAKLMFKAAQIEGVEIRWGADWDRDGKPRERGEYDSPHFELD